MSHEPGSGQLKIRGALGKTLGVPLFHGEGGQLTLVPDTFWEAVLERSGGPEMTPEQSAKFWAEHEPKMLPPDDEP